MTQAILAELVGRSERWLIDVEHGTVDLRLSDVTELARVLDVDSDVLERNTDMDTTDEMRALGIRQLGDPILSEDCGDFDLPKEAEAARRVVVNSQPTWTNWRECMYSGRVWV